MTLSDLGLETFDLEHQDVHSSTYTRPLNVRVAETPKVVTSGPWSIPVAVPVGP